MNYQRKTKQKEQVVKHIRKFNHSNSQKLDGEIRPDACMNVVELLLTVFDSSLKVAPALHS